nr:Transposase, MuDR, plant [Ipomoea batatas]
MCSVELVIHHGGNFVKDYVWEVDIDPDLLSYPHLVKFIKEGQYGKIETLYYKALHEPLDKLRVLWNDASVLELTELAIKYRSCDIYVDHGIDDADLIPCYMLTGCEEIGEEPTEGIQTVGVEGNVEGTTDVNEEIGEGDYTVGNEDSDDEGNEDPDDEGNEDSDDEGNEGDEDSNDSAKDDTEFSEFENDFGGVTQEDNTHIYEGAAKGKGVEVKATVKTTKAKASEVKEVEVTDFQLKIVSHSSL